MKIFISAVGALTLLAGCALDDQRITAITPHPSLYQNRYGGSIFGGRVVDDQERAALANAEQTMARRGQTLGTQSDDSYTIDTINRPQGSSYSGSVTSTPRSYGVMTQPEPMTPPAGPSTPQPVAEPPREASAPIATPVPGKPGYVVSPFAPKAGYVDVTGMTPGTEAKDPYTGRVFRVP